MRNERLEWFLRIMSFVREADTSEYRANWLNVFCNDTPEKSDTFNLALNRGYVRASYDGDTETGSCRITPIGDAFVASLTTAPESVPTRGTEQRSE